MCAMINGYGFDMGLGFGQIQTGGAPAQTLPGTDPGYGDFFSGSPGLSESGPVGSNVNDLLGGIGSWATEGAQGQQAGGGDQVQQIMQSVMEKLAQGDIQGALAELMKLLGGGQGQGQGQGAGGGGGGGEQAGGAAPVGIGGGGGGGGGSPSSSNSSSDSSSSSSSNSNSTVNNNITINNILACEEDKPACDKPQEEPQPQPAEPDPKPGEPDPKPSGSDSKPSGSDSKPSGGDSQPSGSTGAPPDMKRGEPS